MELLPFQKPGAMHDHVLYLFDDATIIEVKEVRAFECLEWLNPKLGGG